MIAGPILPRTADGLWEAVRHDPGRLERGLRIVRKELVLEGGLAVDALAADAVGAPVLMFLALIDRDRDLPGRIAEARDWFARNAAVLAPILEGAGLRTDLPPRVFVVGFELSAGCIDRLRREARPEDGVFRIEGLYIDGVRHVGAVRILGESGGGSGNAALCAPPGGAIGARARRFSDLLQRLDPDLVVDGDRYSRTWRLDGTTVLRLERDARSLCATVPGLEVREILGDEDVVEVFDVAMRRYLAVLDGTAEPESVPALEPARPAGAAPARAGLARATGNTEVTADEFEAFFADDVRGGLS